MRKVYLAGSIFGLPDKGQTWRRQAIDLLSPYWEAVNPNLFELALSNPAELVEYDYDLINGCAAIIARVRNPSWGTAMELAHAKSINVPVIGWPFLREITPVNYSPWLIHHVGYYAATLPQAVGVLNDL